MVKKYIVFHYTSCSFGRLPLASASSSLVLFAIFGPNREAPGIKAHGQRTKSVTGLG